MVEPLERLYKGRCNVYENQSYKRSDHSTGFKNALVEENVPCRLSFKNITTTSKDGHHDIVTSIVKLFLDPTIEITPGSTLEITQNNRTSVYRRSGEPSIYSTHQEIILELVEENT